MKILNRTIYDKSKYLNEKLFRFMKKTSFTSQNHKKTVLRFEFQSYDTI